MQSFQNAALAALLVGLVVLALVQAWHIWTGPVQHGLGLHTLVAFGQSVSASGVMTQINGVPDQSITVQVGDIRIPGFASQLVMVAVLSNDASAARAQLSSPSLRAMINDDIEPVIANKVFGSPIEPYWRGSRPIPLVVNESLNLFVQNAQAAAVLHYGLVWLADGPVAPVTGNVFSIRATSTVALVARAWVDDTLGGASGVPYVQLQVVGVPAPGADLAAAGLRYP